MKLSFLTNCVCTLHLYRSTQEIAHHIVVLHIMVRCLLMKADNFWSIRNFDVQSAALARGHCSRMHSCTLSMNLWNVFSLECVPRAKRTRESAKLDQESSCSQPPSGSFSAVTPSKIPSCKEQGYRGCCYSSLETDNAQIKLSHSKKQHPSA